MLTRLRADHVTLARMLLLPLPVAMLLGGSREWLLASLAAFTLLGLTDIADGPLARRAGSSPAGPLLDTLSDRVFLAVVYCALAEFGVLPLALLQALLAREFFVVSLRGLFPPERGPWLSGKLKTAVQMFGAGFLLLLRAQPGGPWFTLVSGTGLALSAALGLAIAIRHRVLDWRAAWGVVLTACLLVARLVGGIAAARGATLIVIVAVTFASAAQLLVRHHGQVVASLVGRPGRVVRLLATTCIVPLLWAPQLARGPLCAMTATVLVAAELAILVLGNALDEQGRTVHTVHESWRLGALGVAGLELAIAGGDRTAGVVLSFAALALLATVLIRRGRAVAAVLAMRAGAPADLPS